MSGRGTPAKGEHRVYWTLRVLESVLMLVMILGIGMFAWSLIDVVRLETTKAAAGAMPATAWPGILVFFGALVLLQFVRASLVRYRRDDGTPRGDARDMAADATAEVLSAVDDEERVSTSDTGTGARGGDHGEL